MDLALQYPVFGPEIICPHCRQIIPALTLTDTYLCSRHGAFEADPKIEELVHLPLEEVGDSGKISGIVSTLILMEFALRFTKLWMLCTPRVIEPRR
jgi:hypothetical protein